METNSVRTATAIQIALVLVVIRFTSGLGWAEAGQTTVVESARTERIRELQRERAKVEGELRQLRSQPEGMARSTAPRSELSDQPTRSMKESLESVPGVSARQGSGGRDVPLSIRGSK